MRKIRSFLFFVSLFFVMVAALLALSYKDGLDHQKSCAELGIACEPTSFELKLRALREWVFQRWK